jgi:hypothetical protein
MNEVGCLPLEYVNSFLEPRSLQGNIPLLVWCWTGPDLPHQ